MSVRIKDIAEVAGVSSATVSLVLNGKKGVGDAKRAEILRIASELGYRGGKGQPPSDGENRTLCFLRIARHGHIINRDHDVFIADYIEGLNQGCSDAGCSLQIVTFKSDPFDKILEFARESDARGLIILGTELSEEEVLSFRGLTVPLVFIDTMYKYADFDFVDMNNEDSVHAVVAEFVEHGHRDIGVVSGRPGSPNLNLRKQEFLASLEFFGLPFRPECAFAVDPTFHGAYENMKAILGRRPSLPTALFCANDIIAAGCLRALREGGVKVPRDISLIGFDDLPLASIADPPLTTVKVSKTRIGRTAVRLLSDRIESGNRASISKVVVSGKLVRRDSVRRIGG